MVTYRTTWLICFLLSVSVMVLAARNIASDPLPVGNDEKGCEAGAKSAREQCATEMENRWYDGGAVSYMREDRIKDFPLCERIGRAAFFGCSNYGKGEGIALPGPPPDAVAPNVQQPANQ